VVCAWVLRGAAAGAELDCTRTVAGWRVVRRWTAWKTGYCDAAGLRVHWILNEEVFRPFRLCGDVLEATSRPRLEIVSVLSYCALELPCAAFYVDLTRPLRQTWSPSGASQELPPGLYQLSSIWHMEAIVSFVDFFRLKIVAHHPGLS
jgi:hypothetical protein